MLAADDFALTAGVSRGILALAEAGRISATGAMSNRPDWPVLARDLKRFDGHIAVGLHLNLTLGAPLGALHRLAPAGELPSFNQLLRGALTLTLPVHEVRAEIGRQLDAFAHEFGRAPDYVDGHQHVHVLPGVRTALLSALAERGLAGRTWLRDPADRPGAILRRGVAAGKASVIAALSARFGQAARAAGFATNDGFSGVSAFDAQRDFGANFARFLVAAGPRHLVMCHPGEIDDELRRVDPVVETRPQEMAFLLSQRFLDLCAEAALRPSAAWDRPT